jgi:hypothetical protein
MNIQKQISTLSENKYFIPFFIICSLIGYTIFYKLHTTLCLKGKDIKDVYLSITGYPQPNYCKYCLHPILMVLGIIFLFLAPGYPWVLCLFDKNELDGLERFTLAIGLSISLVVLLWIYLNIGLKIKFERRNVFLSIFFISLSGLVAWYYLRVYRTIPEPVPEKQGKNKKHV